MPSYLDQMYGSYYDSYYLEHHGIKGQKWGIRRFQNEDGTRTAAGMKRYSSKNSSNVERLKNAASVGSAERVRQKQQMFENKIKKSGDKNILVRNTLNDWRRGRIAQLKTKAAHREAKEAYKQDKTSANRARKNALLGERLVKNWLLNVSTNSRGTYNRYRANGDSIADSVLKVSGKVLLTRIV